MARIPGPGVPLPWGPANTHLQHIVTIVMENRDYDTYFGEYCLQRGAYCSSVGNGIPAETCVPYDPNDSALGCIAPFNLTGSQLAVSDLEHDWQSGRTAWDGGAMDNFYLAEGNQTLPFGHYNGSTIPLYWDLAEQYGLGDNFFAGNLSYSLPNHWDLVAGQSPPIAASSFLTYPAQRSAYRSQANSTATVQDLLNRSGVSWKYYDWNLLSYPNATHDPDVLGDGSAYNYWNPMAGRAESYTPWYSAHFVPRSTFVSDALAGTLPQLSWVIPEGSYSDHPPANVSDGEAWVAQLVNAVESSPDWSTTAIFLTWDDYGGFYDHVSPPTVMGSLLSFRAPLIVIGPYVKENHIGHRFLDFFSLLHFAEWQFRLGCLTEFDCTAHLPFDFFDFNQTARAPMVFPTNATQATYPEPLQRPGQPEVRCPTCSTVLPLNWTVHLPKALRFVDPS